MEVITRGFIERGLRNNACKRHLQVMIVVENRNVKSDEVEKGPVISFSNNDFLKGFDRDDDDHYWHP